MVFQDFLDVYVLDKQLFKYHKHMGKIPSIDRFEPLFIIVELTQEPLMTLK